jgi:hypothetical protein
MVSTAGETWTKNEFPFAPSASGVMLVLPAATPRMVMSAESRPAGMNAGSGETCATPAVENW